MAEELIGSDPQDSRRQTVRARDAIERRVPPRTGSERCDAGADARPVSTAHARWLAAALSVCRRRAEGRACVGTQNHRVRPLDYPLLADENIAADVVAGFRARGCDVRPAEEERLIGRGDSEVLERATALHRVVVTHDLAFGKVEIRGGASFVGTV